MKQCQPQTCAGRDHATLSLQKLSLKISSIPQPMRYLFKACHCPQGGASRASLWSPSLQHLAAQVTCRSAQTNLTQKSCSLILSPLSIYSTDGQVFLILIAFSFKICHHPKVRLTKVCVFFSFQGLSVYYCS